MKGGLPDAGVYVTTEFGEVLFHHIGMRHLKDEDIARLAEFGIWLRKQPPRFSPAEDRTIKDNWRRLSEKYQLNHEQPLYYAGFGSSKGNKNSHRAELTGIPFWPEMCRGLDNRSAKQIRYRIGTLLNPFAWNPETDETSKFGNSLFTLEDEENLMYLHEVWSGNWWKISTAMNFPVHTLRNHYHQGIKLSRWDIPVDRGHWLKLWYLVKLHQNWMEKKDGKLVKKLVREKSLEVKDFEELATCMRRTVDVVKVAWNDILRALHVEIEGGKSATDAFEEVVRAGAYPVTYMQRAVFVNIYRQYVPPNCFSLHNARKDIDMKAVDSKRKAAGLTNFYVASGSHEQGILLWYTKKMVRLLRERILNHITLTIDAKGILTVIVRTCVRIEKEQGKLSRRRHVIAVEELVRFIIEEIKSDWIPPWKLEHYIQDENLRKNLVKNDNSNYRKQGKHGEPLYSRPKYMVCSMPQPETQSEVIIVNASSSHGDLVCEKKKKKRKGSENEDNEEPPRKRKN